MSICSYLYASGLRVESGRAVVELDGKRYRVVRNGKGASRLDRPSGDPRSDGEITLKDLEARLAAEGRSVVTATVATEHGSFPLTLDPANAMGRQGREALEDHAKAYDGLFPDEQRALAAYQIKTLPYQSASDPDGFALKRLRAALRYVKLDELSPDVFSEGFWSITKGSDVRAQALWHVLSTDPTKFTHEELVGFFKEYPRGVLEHAAGRFSDEEIAVAFEDALAFRDAPSDEGLIRALLQNAGDRIPGALINKAFTNVMNAPAFLRYGGDILQYASDRLTDEQVSSAFETLLADQQSVRPKSTGAWAAVLKHASDRLSDEQVSAAFVVAPLAALTQMAHRLSSDHLAICAVRHPGDALAHAAAFLSPAQLAAAVDADPASALEHAAALLSPAQLATAAKDNPQAALVHAAAHLSPQTLDELIEEMPAAVITHAAGVLTSAQFDRAFDKDGLHLTALIHAASCLTDAHLSRIVIEEPSYALQYAGSILSEEQLGEAVKRAPHEALEYVSDRLTDDQFGLLVASHPAEALTYAADRLTNEQFSLAFAASPVAALKAAPERLSNTQIDFLIKNHPKEVFESPSMPHQARVAACRANGGIISTVYDHKAFVEYDRVWCVDDRAAFEALLEADPEEAVKHVPEKITVAQLDRVVDAAPVDVYMAHRGRLSKAQISRIIDAEPLAMLEELGGVGFSPEQLERAFAANTDLALIYMRSRPDNKKVPIPSHLLDLALDSAPTRTLLYAAAELSPAQISTAFSRDMAATLRHASAVLSAEQLSTAVTQRPGDAIRFAADRLTDEQFAVAVERTPSTALAYAAARLTDSQLAEVLKREPGDALQFAADRLTDRQLARAVDDCDAPAHVLQYVPHRLSRRQLDAALKQDNTLAPALKNAWPYLSEKQRNKLIDGHPGEVLRVRAHSLTNSELSRAARLAPKAALEHASDLFDRSARETLWEMHEQRLRERRNSKHR